jgi:5-methylcytosine-specific restriction endonuclease McrA
MSRSRMATFCPYCGRIVPAGKVCPCRRKAQPKRKRKPSPNDEGRDKREPWRKEYRSKEFRENRQKVIASQRGKCCDCGRTCAWFDGLEWRTAGMGGEVDHVVPLCEGGSNDVTNLRLRCASCHRRKDLNR